MVRLLSPPPPRLSTHKAYDFLKLFQERKCRVQLGGSDQFGNIASGIELIRRVEGATAYGITLPLVTTASGVKFGKSMGNAVWLDASMTPEFDLYQFFLRTDDRDVGRYLRMFTLLPLDAIDAAMAEHGADPGRRGAQRLLAGEMLALVHGTEAAERAQALSHALYEEPALLSEDMLEQLRRSPAAFEGIVEMDAALLGRATVGELLVQTGLEPSRAAARRCVQAGGVRINEQRVADAGQVVGREHVSGLHARVVILRKGKRERRVLWWR